MPPRGWRKYQDDGVDVVPVPIVSDVPINPPEVARIKAGDFYRHYAERNIYRLVTLVSGERIHVTPCTFEEPKGIGAWPVLHAHAVAMNKTDWQGQLDRGKWILIENVGEEWKS